MIYIVAVSYTHLDVYKRQGTIATHSSFDMSGLFDIRIIVTCVEYLVIDITQLNLMVHGFSLK